MVAAVVASVQQLKGKITGVEKKYKPGELTADLKDLPSERICSQLGIASWYKTAKKGKITASGEKYYSGDLIAASRWFPFGTKLNVINLGNRRNVTVTVIDRGPYVDKRVLDLSVEAAQELGMKRAGLAPVCVQKITNESDSDKE